MLFVDDYYRARNAGEFAELQGDREVYRELYVHFTTGQCRVNQSTVDVPLSLNKIMHLMLESLHSAQQDKRRLDIIF